MFSRPLTTVLHAAFFIISVAQTNELARRPGGRSIDAKQLNELCRLDTRPTHGSYTNLLDGILQSNHFIPYASQIHCDKLQIDKLQLLKQDPDKNIPDLVDHICHDNVNASIIKDFPQPFRDAFSKIIIVAFNLPNGIRQDAEDNINDAIDFIEDIEKGHPPGMEQISGENAENARSIINSVMSKFTDIFSKSPKTATSFPPCPAATSITATNGFTTKVVATTASSKELSPTRVSSHPSSIPKSTVSNGPVNSSLSITDLFDTPRSFPSMPSATQTPNLGARTLFRLFDLTSMTIWTATILSVSGAAIFS